MQEITKNGVASFKGSSYGCFANDVLLIITTSYVFVAGTPYLDANTTT